MPDIEFERRSDGVALITFNRPEVMNSLGGDAFPLFQDALRECTDDDAIRCVAITGTGRAFCAGADVKGMAGRPPGSGGAMRGDSGYEDRVANIKQMGNDTTGLLYNMPKPTVALVNGVAAGGGFAFALACDIRFAAESARFGTAYARIGLSSDFGTAFLLERIAPGFAHELVYTADVINVERAKEMGLVNRVIPDDQLMEEGLAFCARIASGPTFALKRSKANLQAARVGTFQSTMDLEAEHLVEAFASEDHAVGARAFVEKDRARFVGR